MRVVRGDRDLVCKCRTETLDGADGWNIIRVASDDDRIINRPDKWRDGAAGLERITMTAELLMNRKADVSGTIANMLGISNAKIDVANIGAVRSQDAEVIRRDKIAWRIAGNKPDEMQSHLTVK